MQRTQGRNQSGHVLGQGPAQAAADSIPALSKQLPPVVYFISARGLIKIGHTVDLHQRKRHHGATWDDLLAFRPGSRADEAAIHAQFAEHLAEPAAGLMKPPYTPSSLSTSPRATSGSAQPLRSTT